MISCPYCNHQFEESGAKASKCPQCKRQLQPSGTRTLNVSDQQEKSNFASTISPADQSDSTPETKSDRGLQNTIHAGSETVHHSGYTGPQSPAESKPVFPLSSPGQIRKLVQSIAGPSARPGMTIKQNDGHKVQVDALVLQRRSITSQQQADADESDYQIVKSIGEGGMGTVFAARQTSVRRDVAVKTLKSKLASDQFDRKKFLKEACITAGLDHPNIVPVYDLGISDDGTLFYSMKLIRGKSWVEVFDEKSRVENLDILIRVCDALAFAHSRRIIHRDIKPENVMIGAFGEVLVTDWGLALDMNQSMEFSFGGSPAYMAPEMASHDATKIGIASDIYLLGASLFEIVTGYPPHPGRTATECVLAASENVILPYEKSDNLLDVALQAMATDARDRYQTVAEFQAAIRQYQSQLESIAFTENGYESLKHAKANADFESFSRSLFSFKDAVKLWPENTKAIQGERETRLEYATAALEQKNFDLGLSVLEPETEAEQKVHRDLVQGQLESKKCDI